MLEPGLTGTGSRSPVTAHGAQDGAPRARSHVTSGGLHPPEWSHSLSQLPLGARQTPGRPRPPARDRACSRRERSSGMGWRA